MIPQDIFCTDSTFSTFNEFDEKKKCTVTSGFHQRPQVALPLETNASKDSDNSDKLYSIISEQSKQIEVLQKQIEQILKLQEVKDNQIEQMLKLQQSKEIKIDQLLLSLEVKEKEISKLLRIRDSQEDRIKDLLASNDSLEKEKSQLLKNTKNKETATIGVLTVKQTCDSSTNTSFLECGKYSFNKKDEIEEISSIRVGYLPQNFLLLILFYTDYNISVCSLSSSVIFYIIFIIYINVCKAGVQLLYLKQLF